MLHINIYAENIDMEDTDDSILDDIDYIESLLDDSVVDISPPTIIDVIDLTKESPRPLARSSRSLQRNAEDVSSSHSISSSSDRRRRPLSPIVLGNTQNTHTFVYIVFTF